MKRKTTKEILAESYLELAAKKSINKISVTDIVENCSMTNRNSMKFHCPDCEGVKKTSPKNRIPLASKEDALALGYTPCGMCNP